MFVVGTAFFWTLPRRSYFQYLLSSWDGQNLVAMNALYGLFLLGLGVIAALALAVRRFHKLAVVRTPAAVASAIGGMAVGGLAIYATPFAGAIGVVLAIAGAVLCSMGFGALVFAWGEITAKLPGRELFVDSFLGFGLSFVLLMASVLPSWVFVSLSVGAPVVSGLCLWGFVRSAGDSAKVALTDARPLARCVPLGLILVLVLTLLIGGVIRGLTYPATFSETAILDPIATNAISFVFALCLCLAVSLSSHMERSVYSLWIAVVSFFLCGLLLVATVGSQWAMLGKGLIIIGRSYCAFFLWLVLVDAARRNRVFPERLLAAFFLFPEIVASAISYCILPLCAEMLSPALEGLDVSIFALLSCMLLVVASLVFLRSCLFSGGSTGSEAEAPDAFSRACTAIAEAYGLSVREAQVMEYVGQGLSAKVIAERLFLSVNTVQTHTKNIYRKVGVHTKQELIALIADRRFE